MLKRSLRLGSQTERIIRKGRKIHLRGNALRYTLGKKFLASCIVRKKDFSHAPERNRARRRYQHALNKALESLSMPSQLNCAFFVPKAALNTPLEKMTEDITQLLRMAQQERKAGRSRRAQTL